MKIALVFLLLAVTASYGLAPIPGKSPVTNCFQSVLKADLQKVLSDVQKLLCSYESCMSTECTGKKSNNVASVIEIVQSHHKIDAAREENQESLITASPCTPAEWQVLLTEIKVILKDAGCTVDSAIFQGKQTAEKIEEEVGVILRQLVNNIRTLLGNIYVVEPQFDRLCDYLSDILVKLPQN